MEKLVQLRGTYRGCFTKFTDKLDNFLKTEVDDSDLYVSHLSQLIEKYTKIQRLNDEILNLIQGDGTCTEADICKEIESAESYEDKFIYWKTKLERCINRSDNATAAHSVSESISNKRNFKLPKIELQKFDGNLKDWLSFWGLFKKIDEDSDISNEDKYQYLIQSTLKGSRAREVVESFPPTAENYSQAIECLKSRFGKEDLLIEVYVRELLSLVLNNVTNNETKLPLVKLYDKVETQLRSLKMLGVTSDKYASMLYPLVESCLPIDLLRIWERHLSSITFKSDDKFNKLETLMQFLGKEIEGEEKINLAKSGFGLEYKNKKNQHMKSSFNCNKIVPTGMELYSSVQVSPAAKNSRCVFCDKDNHESKGCHFARNMNLSDKTTQLKKRGCCFRCLATGHVSKFCRVRISCENCAKRHHAVMCPSVKPVTAPKIEETTGAKNADHFNTLPNPTCSPSVFLQTLIVLLRGENEDFAVRALIDSGSQKSYITKEAAMKMKYRVVKETSLIHTLFGGVENKQDHLEYEIFVSNIKKNYHCTFSVLDQEKICSEIHQMTPGFLSQELEDNGICLTEQEGASFCSSPTIHLLIGADIAGKLMTGKVLNLTCGLTAIETLLGWTLLGKSPSSSNSGSSAMTVTNLLVKESTISDLWRLEVIQISDPAETKVKSEMHQDTLKYFESTVMINEEGRYEVALPWVLEPSRLSDNRKMAEKRLDSVYQKLLESDKMKVYADIFDKWISEGIIEEVEDDEAISVHYLPHRPVFKESSATTKVRPVFDASAHTKGLPSLNACLETGPNLIELVPSLMNRFRKFPVGVTSDIEKAFLQIGIREKDRNYLRFLWRNQDKEVKILRHRRMVFGINCSPFLLAATLNYHLERAPETLSDTAQILKNSFYVDNCVCSLKTTDEANKFIRESQTLMSSGKFNLRGWQSNAPVEAPDRTEDQNVSLLGLNWNLQEDTLSCIVNYPEEDKLILTKRLLLSLAQSIFDPLGISSPVTIIPKFMLQESWNLALKWDDVLPEDLSRRFLNWLGKIQCLSEIRVPRWMKIGQSVEEIASLHVFCDASAKAYATCIFLRVEVNNEVAIRFVQSRARVAPLKNITIPRLELLACCIGSRLCASIVQDLKLENLKVFYWTDSLTALCWIKRDSPWGTFVWNRVQEIRTLTEIEQWRHVPGKLNPADLPTRGCSAEQFLKSKWWEGPLWLHSFEENWPQSTEVANEDFVNAEKKKTVLSAFNHTENALDWYDRSSHLKNIRKLAWIRRFYNNCRKIKTCASPALSCFEIKEAENLFMLLVQKEVFNGPSDPRFHSLNVISDENGLLRVKTRVIYRQDTEDFKYPVILPGDHPAVENLIMDKHRMLMHCGNQILLARLREKYWILKGRKSIRRILNSCVRCRRFNSRPVKMNLPPLPEDRVSDAGAFEVSGVDLAGPLFLRDGSKVWIALFTCAVYRGIHLELLSSLSTESFLLALRRFIARRGRPAVVYSDNGTNFLGAHRFLHCIDWRQVEEEGTKTDIIWKFIPPSAPWWGGWWERLIALVKDLLKKVLGRASLRYEELNTLLCDCEDIVNSRPLTYLSEEADLEPLTPTMFLREPRGDGVPNLDKLELSSENLRKRKVYKCKLREDIRSRFRLEYLGKLRDQTKKIRSIHEFKVGEIVLVEVPNQKRLNWPLGKILEIFPGKDGIVRLTKVKTKSGEFLRPAQRLYALEVQAPLEVKLRDKRNSEKDYVQETGLQQDVKPRKELRKSGLISSPERNAKKNRFGREIRVPRRLDL